MFKYMAVFAFIYHASTQTVKKGILLSVKNK